MNKLRYVISATLFGLLIWQGLVWITGAPHFILPSPWRVAQAAWSNRGLISENALVTATEVVLGLILGSLLGVVTAVQLASSARLHRLVMPLLVFTQAVPVFALAPILTLWFGYGIASKVGMAVLIIYFPVTSAFYDGLTNVPRDILDMARTMGGNNWQIMRRIRIPHALPSLGTGLKLAAVYAHIGAVIGEWVGASRGLGYLMLLANGRAKTDLMFASLITLALMTIALHVAANMAATYLKRD
ncbi:MAG: ABC transporter permease [Litoreibacter sp.]